MADEEEVVLETVGEAGKSLADQADARILVRLHGADAARAEQRARRREDEARAADPRENVQRFGDAHRADAEAVEAAVASALASGPPKDAAALRATLDGLRRTLVAMDRRAAESAYFLPAYDVRAASERVKALRAKVDDAQKTLLPRRSFAFSRGKGGGGVGARKKAGKGADEGASKARSDDDEPKPLEARRGFVLDGRKHADVRYGVRVGDPPLPSDDVEISQAEGCAFRFGSGGEKGDGAGSATVGRKGLATLRLVGLRRCAVACESVQGSVYVDGCEDCVVAIKRAQQIRIHTTTRCDFYLNVRSHPIIEKCRAVRFGKNRL